jgi:hypothetical protein
MAGAAATGNLIRERVGRWNNGYVGKAELVQAWAKRYDEWAPPGHSYAEGDVRKVCELVGLSRLTNLYNLNRAFNYTTEQVLHSPVNTRKRLRC